MNSSDERARAMTWNQARIGLCPKTRMIASAIAALPAAIASELHRSEPPAASVGTAIRNATTARS